MGLEVTAGFWGWNWPTSVAIDADVAGLEHLVGEQLDYDVGAPDRPRLPAPIARTSTPDHPRTAAPQLTVTTKKEQTSAPWLRSPKMMWAQIVPARCSASGRSYGTSSGGSR